MADAERPSADPEHGRGRGAPGCGLDVEALHDVENREPEQQREGESQRAPAPAPKVRSRHEQKHGPEVPLVHASAQEVYARPKPVSVDPQHRPSVGRLAPKHNGGCTSSDRFRDVEAKHDVLVVGAGCAGMRAAIEAHDTGADVALISKIHPVRSHSGAAEGGINAALGNASEYDPEKHAFDTVKGSDYLGDQDAIQVLCDDAPDDVYQLENWGAVFSRTEDGRIAQRPFGAAGEPRTAYAADITGHVLVHVLYEQGMKRDILT